MEVYLTSEDKDHWGNPPELPHMTSFSEGIVGVRCDLCGHLVEDMSATWDRCALHVDSES